MHKAQASLFDKGCVIESLQQMTYANFRILLVDNQSSDATVESVRSTYPDVDILVLPQNAGFAGGMNPGLRYALEKGADLVLIINNDVIVEPAMLTELVAGMRPGLGMTVPKIYYSSDQCRIWSVGFGRHPLALTMTGGGRGCLDDGQWQSPLEVDYVPGCAMLLTKSMLEEVGLFDERFFFYYEDLDLCIRAQQCGYRILMVPAARMWHKVSASAGMGSPFRTYHMALSSVLFYHKHARGIRRSVVLLLRSGSAIKTTLTLLVQRRSAALEAYWRGIADGISQCMQCRLGGQ
jgi:GT2 family glycosyltransferase